MTSIMLFKCMLFANAFRKQKKKIKPKKPPIKKAFKTRSIRICRICDKEKGAIPIFNNSGRPNISEDIHQITGIKMSESDGFSKHMCQNCLYLLNGCIMFRKMCQKTNEKLIEMAATKNNTEHGRAAESNAGKEIHMQYKISLEPYDTKDINMDNNEAERSGIQSRQSSYSIPSPVFSDISSHPSSPKPVEETTCKYCEKKCVSQAAYDIHLRRCVKKKLLDPPKEKKRLFLCDVCGKTEASITHLVNHMSTHKNVFPYKCDVCPYRGRTKELLKGHKRTHLAIKPFQCPHCPTRTATGANMIRHTRTKHSTLKPFKCNDCGKEFKFRYHLNWHIRDVHLKLSVVECDMCSKKFVNKKRLSNHQVKVHKIRGKKNGRLPDYLLCQMEEQNENR